MRKEKSVENCASGDSDHLQGKGSVSRVGRWVCQPGTGATDQLASLHCISSLLCRLTAVQAAPTHTTGHVAGLPAGSSRGREAAQAKEERCSLHFAMQLHRPQSCHALALRPLALNCLHCKAAALHWQASNFVQCNAHRCLPMHSLPCTAIV